MVVRTEEELAEAERLLNSAAQNDMRASKGNREPQLCT